MRTEYQKLLAEYASLQQQINSTRHIERDNALQEVQRLIVEFRLSVFEVYGNHVNVRRNGSPPAKYRDPRTGKTWSGRGRPPAWIANMDRTPFLIRPKTD